jgi:hypothetical protein
MKRNDNKNQNQTNQAEQTGKDAVIRVRSGLRAGATTTAVGGGCCPPGDDAII